MTRLAIKMAIMERFEFMDDDYLIDFYNAEREATIYTDIDELFSDQDLSLSEALEALDREFEYDAYSHPYYVWDSGTIYSFESLTDIIDLDDMAECLIADIEHGVGVQGFGDIDTVAETFTPEILKLRNEETREKIEELRQKYAEIAEALKKLEASYGLLD